MLNIVTNLNKKSKRPKVDASYNRRFHLALQNMELTSKEEKFYFTKALLENHTL